MPQDLVLPRPLASTWMKHRSLVGSWGWLLSTTDSPDSFTAAAAAADVAEGSPDHHHHQPHQNQEIPGSSSVGFTAHAKVTLTRVPVVLGAALQASGLKVSRGL